jgi:ADP-ribose pyrophosphatase
MATADHSRNASPASWLREADGAHDQTIESNWLFQLRRERFRSRQSDKVHDYYVMHLADAVNVIALTPDDQVLLVSQFRAGSGEDSLETPGGLLDPGEDPCAAGARELLEETGHAGDPAILVCQAFANPSIMTSRTATILITNAVPVAELKPDSGEELTIQLAPVATIPHLIRTSRINHALTVMGLLWWLNTRPGAILAEPQR